jgi:hypothetical protein
MVFVLALHRGPVHLKPICRLALRVAIATGIVLVPALTARYGGSHVGLQVAAAASIAWTGTLEGLILVATTTWVRRSMAFRRRPRLSLGRRLFVATAGFIIGLMFLSGVLTVGQWMAVGVAGLAPIHSALEMVIATTYVIVHESCHRPIGQICQTSHRLVEALVDFAITTRITKAKVNSSASDRVIYAIRRLATVIGLTMASVMPPVVRTEIEAPWNERDETPKPVEIPRPRVQTDEHDPTPVCQDNALQIGRRIEDEDARHAPTELPSLPGPARDEGETARLGTAVDQCPTL